MIIYVRFIWGRTRLFPMIRNAFIVIFNRICTMTKINAPIYLLWHLNYADDKCAMSAIIAPCRQQMHHFGDKCTISATKAPIYL